MNLNTTSFKKWGIFFVTLIAFLSGCGGASDEGAPPPGGDPNKVLGPNDCLTDTTILPLINSLALADSSKGGKIYDKWWSTISADAPTTDHALWSTQTDNTRTGEDTWRCKECHGWDYKGVDGVYGDQTNSHYTGFTGVFDARTKDPIDVYCAIHSGTKIDSRHNFSDVLSNTDILHVTKFIVASQDELGDEQHPKGVIDSSQYISAQGMPIGATASNGEILFSDPNVDCASSSCHGSDGTGQHEAIGTLADANPWETLHKIRFGHPGANMPAYASSTPSSTLSIQQAIDIIAFAQESLPSTAGDNTGSTACLTDPTILPLINSLSLADTSKGGKIYDKWWSAISANPPTTDHALWSTQTTNTRTGEDTWRCKECHGWDYKGVDGVYGDQTNSHYTGFGGIFDARTKGPINVYCAIHSGTAVDSRHNFSDVLSNTDILHVTKFIVASQDETTTEPTPTGVIDTSMYISAQGAPISATATNGEILFSDTNVDCSSSSCHGPDGTRQHEAVGTLADDNPWETLHKIRFGHPGSNMPAFATNSSATTLTMQQAMDIIAYAQESLPNTSNNTSTCLADFTSYVSQTNLGLASSIEGGRLYDNWAAEIGTTPLTVDHALWDTRDQPTINTRSGADTWRCKECHGWDYKGVDGVYGNTSNNHYTGFPGVMAASNKSALELFCAIRSGTGINPDHAFSGVLSNANILNLAKFLTVADDTGLLDTNTYINATTGDSLGNSTTGQVLFDGSNGCSASNCHGTDGTVQHETLGGLSNGNPWEVMHKIRFGHPGAIMPSYSDQGIPYFSLTEIRDVIAYTQTLPLTPPGGGTNPPTNERQDIARGGRLFDNWIVEKGAPIPPVDNPTWALQTFTGGTNNATGASTWRCKECHGWDYKGSAGIYGDTASSHYTGFGGLLNTVKTEQEIVTYLTNGAIIFGQHVHIFDGLLTLKDMQDLAKFIKNGMVDSFPAIKADGFVNGLPANFANGRELYRWTGDFGVPNGNCEWCHNTDGVNLDIGVDLGNVARNNPWETLHKIRFGQPGSLMPALTVQTDALTGNAAFTFQDAIDIIQFTQCLPNSTCWTQ